MLKSQSSRTPRGKGRVLLQLKTKTSRAPWGKCHLLLLSKTFIRILVHNNQSSLPALIELLLHNSWFMRLLRIVRLVFFFGQKVQNIDKNACRHMFRKEVVVDEPSKDNVTTMLKFFSCHKKYQHQEPLKDLGIPGMTVEEFWEDCDKDHNKFEYGKPLVTKQVHAKSMWT
jgi:hypothetical protein